MKLTFYMLNAESPAQGAAKHVNVATCLSADDIRNWCASYLSDDAMAVLDHGTLHALQGRPLFASCFWDKLVGFSSSTLSAAENVQQAITLALTQTADDARTRVQSLWRRHEAEHVLCGLYVSLKAGHGGSVQIKAPAMRQVESAFLEGVLNIDPNVAAVDIDLGKEPITAKAILDIGNELLATTEWHDDPVVQALQGRRFGFFGSEKARGGNLEELFVWHVLKTCQKQGGEVALKEVLWGDQDDKFWPKALDGRTVRVKYGLRCDPNRAGFLSKFAGANGEPRFDRVLHIPPIGAASAAVLFPARDDQGNFRQVGVQVNDQIAPSLPDALRRLDMGTWYPDQMTERGPVRTQRNRDFMVAFSKHPQWFACPVRVVLHSKEFTSAVLCTAAYYNVAVIPEQPIVLTTFGKLRSHKIGRKRNDNPKRLTTFTPTPVPCWEETQPGKSSVPHPHQYLVGRPVFAKLEELPDAGDTLLITCEKKRRDAVEKEILRRWQSARLSGGDDCHDDDNNNDDDGDDCCKIIITFAHVHDAIECQQALETNPHGYWRELGVRSVKVQEALNKRRK